LGQSDTFWDRRAQHRGTAGHLAFDAGPHIYSGSFLVRLETKIAFNALRDHYERIDLAEQGDFEPFETPMFYGPAKLLRRFHLAGARAFSRVHKGRIETIDDSERPFTLRLERSSACGIELESSS